MFVLHDVASSALAGVGLLLIIYFIPDVPCGFTATLNIILSYKFYFAFSCDIKCISTTCINISIYMLVCENYIFIHIFDISFTFYISHDGYFHKNALYIKFFNNISLPDVASSLIQISNVRSDVLSVSVIVGEEAEGNKAEICTDRC